MNKDTAAQTATNATRQAASVIRAAGNATKWVLYHGIRYPQGRSAYLNLWVWTLKLFALLVGLTVVLGIVHPALGGRALYTFTGGTLLSEPSNLGPAVPGWLLIGALGSAALNLAGILFAEDHGHVTSARARKRGDE